MSNKTQTKSDVLSVKQEDKISINKQDKPSILTRLNDYLKNVKISKFKGGKIAIPLLLLAVVMIIYINLTSSTNSIITSTTEEASVNFTSGLDYINQIEEKLENLLGSIKNAGKVSVMISIDSSPKLTIAQNIEEKTVTTSSGTTVTTVTEPIIINKNGESTPLVVMETLPEIKGVIVVSEGASDVKVKLDIITAVKALLGISSGNIEVFTGI